MDLDIVWKVIQFVILPVLGWLMNTLWNEHKVLIEKLNHLSIKIPETYATKEDVKDLGRQIMERFDKLDEKLDKKADK